MNSSDSQTRGFFLAIEGTDGSGKGTQARLLADRLKREGYDVAEFDFPQYSQPSSHFVKEYLNGRYGTAEQVGPYVSSLFYALDRYEAAPRIREALHQGKVVLANRYTGSNMAHQGTKFAAAEERRGYFTWLDNLEFEMMGIPRPDKSFVLRVPAEIAQSLVDEKEDRDYTDKKRDIHEADLNHLRRAVEVYDDICQLFPKDFTRIDCVRSGHLLSIEEVHDHLWKTIEPYLPSKPNHPVLNLPAPAHFEALPGEPTEKHPLQAELNQTKTSEARMTSKSITQDTNPFVTKTDKGYEITDEGRKFLEQAVTSLDDDVYAFTDHLSPATIAAAMARLSRRGDDMRITLLDEFAQGGSKDEQLLRRIITAYGDDSVQQLAGQHIVVENASNLLTKKLEWGRLGAYLEQSTRYIYFDQKDANGKYKYYTPDHLSDEVKQEYEEKMDQIFDTYSDLVQKMTHYIRANSTVQPDEQDAAWRSATKAQACDAIRPILPVATKATVGIFDSGQALESLIMHLLSDELPEARTTGQKILEQARKVMPTFLERADKPERGGAAIAYRANTFAAVKKLAEDHLPDNYSGSTEPVRLTSLWPRNELDLVPDMLYEHSNLPLENIQQIVASWPINRKQEVLHAYMGERLNRRHRPGRALEKAHYSWDLVCDYGIFRDLQRHRMVDDLEWQQLTPRYGYDIPKLVEEAGLTEQFEKCFDISLELYSTLQQHGYQLEAQYATLLGHKMRWKITYNAREAFHLHELRTTPQGHPGYRKLVQQMHEKLAENHPMLAEAMKFVNQDEDPELTRLAAERYTQFKLNQLDQQ